MEFSDFEDVKNRILKLKSDLEVSNNEKFGLHDELKQAQQKAGQSAVKFENTEKERLSLVKQLSDLKDAVDILQNERLKLSQKLQQTQSENQRLNDRLKRTDDDIDNAKDLHMKYNTELGKMNQITAKNEALNRDLTRLRTEKDKMADELEQTGGQCRNLAREVDQKTDALTRARKDLEAAEEEKNRLWTKLQHGDSENFVERSVADRLKEENDRLQKKVEMLTQSYDESKELSDQYFREIRAMKENIADFKGVQKQFEELKEESSNQGGNVAGLNQQLMMVNQELETVRSDNLKIAREYQKLKEENEYMLVRLNKIHSERNRGLSDIAKELDGL